MKKRFITLGQGIDTNKVYQHLKYMPRYSTWPSMYPYFKSNNIHTYIVKMADLEWSSVINTYIVKMADLSGCLL